jgi:UDP-N-acetylmuramoyl-L-alanyl-D-glutamate--2,6-diaminopimelate ligase
MVKQGCQYAVIETTSEGIKQYRHFGIDYTVAVFTNLTPEHIESHGSFEKYKQAKGKLFAALKPAGASAVNIDDPHSPYFLEFPAQEKWGYGIKNYELRIKSDGSVLENILLKKYELSQIGSTFIVAWKGNSYNFTTKLLGVFNVYNCLAAISAALSQGITIEVIQCALARANTIPGRMEIIRDEKRDITIIVDYAHDPAALENVYKTLQEIGGQDLKKRLIAVLGAVGGGRDTAKRPILGALASRFAKYVIITNEDPYDDDPNEIMNQVEKGVLQDNSRLLNTNYWKILDRRSAIQKAVSLAMPGGIIALTGKGCEEVMAVSGRLIPWDDRTEARAALKI